MFKANCYSNKVNSRELHLGRNLVLSTQKIVPATWKSIVTRKRTPLKKKLDLFKTQTCQTKAKPPLQPVGSASRSVDNVRSTTRCRTVGKAVDGIVVSSLHA